MNYEEFKDEYERIMWESQECPMSEVFDTYDQWEQLKEKHPEHTKRLEAEEGWA